MVQDDGRRAEISAFAFSAQGRVEGRTGDDGDEKKGKGTLGVDKWGIGEGVSSFRFVSVHSWKGRGDREKYKGLKFGVSVICGRFVRRGFYIMFTCPHIFKYIDKLRSKWKGPDENRTKTERKLKWRKESSSSSLLTSAPLRS